MPAGPDGWERASPSSGGAACPTRSASSSRSSRWTRRAAWRAARWASSRGRGVWRLYEDLGVTAVVYDWQVATTKRWMNLLSPIARPVFEYNHDVVMRWGGEGLARRLGVKLLAAG